MPDSCLMTVVNSRRVDLVINHEMLINNLSDAKYV